MIIPLILVSLASTVWLIWFIWTREPSPDCGWCRAMNPLKLPTERVGKLRWDVWKCGNCGHQWSTPRGKK